MIDASYYAVIMAGGGGVRLWPLSRQKQPKQMIRLWGEQSLFELAVARLEGVFAPEKILVVTVAEQAAQLQALCPQIPANNYILEPMGRGTAAVVGLAATVLHKRDPRAVMAVLTADHFIQNVAGFRQLLRAGYAAAQEGYLVTLGIRPTFAATGYGYIQRGMALGEYEGIQAFAVQRFKEKPEVQAAEAMLAQGDHDWNSGMFFWQVQRIAEEIEQYMPTLAGVLHTLEAVWDTPEQQTRLQELWPKLEPVMIDYGIMEKARRVVVLPAGELGWNDMGSWESAFEVLPTDENGNIILSDQFVGVDTEQTFVYAHEAGRVVVGVGLKDLIVVDTADALLICARRDAQSVRKVVALLKEKGYTCYL
jgi:mannose-1-phosphate guanylyltransferase